MDNGVAIARQTHAANEVGSAQVNSGHAPTARLTTPRFALRERSRQEHEATEAAFAPFDISRPDHYRAFLTAHATALPRLELAVTGRGWSSWQPRYPFIADDLAALDAPLPVPMIASDASPVAAWGVQYVLEGSKLGGRMLSARLPHGSPCRYLAAAADMSARWQEFCAALDAEAALGGPGWLDEATEAAIETFQTFRRAADALAGDLP
ncbi:biliverdin-producing heme oxygenase [Croceicoccus ponticola]|uniref:biliverdin-producing heme oxygenase n=1 Tax=Croceicoccus ponticola TaxID=2217664 RepID=UPI001F0BFC7D|nr:biliverdin-producing heme oxygenase [Croceicoccus ponticola]